MECSPNFTPTTSPDVTDYVTMQHSSQLGTRSFTSTDNCASRDLCVISAHTDKVPAQSVPDGQCCPLSITSPGGFYDPHTSLLSRLPEFCCQCVTFPRDGEPRRASLLLNFDLFQGVSSQVPQLCSQHAIFVQVASQSNILEMVGPGVRPDLDFE